MKAIILAAGRGSRMGALTAQSPKCLVQLAGKSLLDYQLNAINDAGINEIAVVAGYNNQMIQDNRIKNKFINSDWEHTNMVCSLMAADEWLSEQSCVISYSDIFYLSSAIKSLINIEADIAITYDPNFLTLWSARFNDPLADLETFRIDPQNRLIEIGNRAKKLEEIHGQFMGLLKITPNGWHAIKSQLMGMQQSAIKKLDVTNLLKHLIAQGIQIYITPYYGLWGEVDNANDLELYESWFAGYN